MLLILVAPEGVVVALVAGPLLLQRAQDGVQVARVKLGATVRWVAALKVAWPHACNKQLIMGHDTNG